MKLADQLQLDINCCEFDSKLIHGSSVKFINKVICKVWNLKKIFKQKEKKIRIFEGKRTSYRFILCVQFII